MLGQKYSKQKTNKSKKVSLSQSKFVGILALILVVNLILSGVVVGVGIGTYDRWGGWFEKNILGKEVKGWVDNGKAGENNNIRGNKENIEGSGNNSQLSVEQVVEKVSPAVVSVIVTKDIPKLERYYEDYNPFGDNFFDNFFGDNFKFRVPRYKQNGTEKKEIGGGTGFIVSSNGLIITNKHVVADKEAEYTVLMNDETKYKAEVLARDPVNDIAVLKIDKKGLPVIKLGNSDKLKVGQSVVAIGNALGEYRNTVSTGIVSGLKRDITASSGYGQSEQLSGVIQTDAAINPGNSGGPLLNMKGEAIGVNVAIVQGSQNIGFSLPINDVVQVLESVKKYGKIVRPWIGVRYLMINKTLKEKNQLPYDYGALIVRGEKVDDLAVIPGSPADKAGIVENDIILEFDGKKLEAEYDLSKAVLKHNVGDRVRLKIYHKGEEKEVDIILKERG